MSSIMIDPNELNNIMYHNAFEIDSDMQKWDGGCWIRYKMFENAMKEVQKVDVEPVRYGHWIEEGLVDGNQNRYCRCSECGKGDTQAISQRVPYCWNCGAKMR